VREADIAWLTAELCRIADRYCGGRVVSMLEGGYDLEALSTSASAHVRALMRS
jgi:acetoin utilization deacetylase AcuC-like enzyme